MKRSDDFDGSIIIITTTISILTQLIYITYGFVYSTERGKYELL